MSSVKMAVYITTSPRRTRVPRYHTVARRKGIREAHLIHRCLMLSLTNWEAVPVDIWFSPMHSSVMGHQ